MSFEMLRSPATSGKITLLILGVVINCFGLYSHFDSAWVKKIWILVSPAYVHVEMYKICEIFKFELDYYGQSCPSIILERYFVSVIIICFVLSIVAFVLVYRIKSHTLTCFDIGYHIIAGALLLPAGVMYIVSDVQIEALIDPEGTGDYVTDLGLRLAEKRVAGGLTIILSILYLCVARTIYVYTFGNDSNKKDGSYRSQIDTI